MSFFRSFLVALLAWSVAANADTLETHLTGVTGATARLLESHLLDSQGGMPGDISPGRVRALHRRAPSILREGLEALGYYEATIDATLVQDGTVWDARYAIDTGEPVLVANVTIRWQGAAKDDAAFIGAVADFPLQVGDRLRHARYEQGKQALRDQLAARGYFDARFTTSDVQVDTQTRRADVVLAIDSGPRFLFGEVRWPTLMLAPSTLQRFVDFGRDAPYSSREVRALQRRLVESNYFGSVALTPRRDLATDLHVPLEVALEPRKSQRYSIGAGFGTDTGPRGRASWQRPYLNARGDHLETDLRISPIRSSLGAQYFVPRQPRWTEALVFSTRVLQEDTDTSHASQFVVGAARLTERAGWQETLGLEYEIEGFDVADATQLSHLLVPSIRWTRTWADDPVFPRDGVRVSFGMRGAEQALISRTSFLQLRLDAKAVRAFGQTRLITRGEVGALAVDDFARLAATERFFAGGDNSVRGFDYQQLGPRDAHGKVIGGHYLLVGSVELERPVVDDWFVAVFSDFGNAMTRFSDPLAYSVGIGARWRSPIGMVRVDLANGISDPDHPWRLHVQVGPDL